MLFGRSTFPKFFVLTLAVNLMGACAENVEQVPDAVDDVGVLSTPLYPEASSVRLYTYDIAQQPDDQKLIGNPEGLILSEDQRRTLEAAIYRKSLKNRDIEKEPPCLIPDHVFRYYGNSGEVVGALNVSIYCQNAEAFPAPFHIKEGEWLYFDITAIEKFVFSLKNSPALGS